MSHAIDCLYFGTFNPIHSGHLMIAQAVLNQFSDVLGIRAVTFIPAANPPHRNHQDDLLAARHRFNMVALATASHPQFRVDDIELRRSEPSYTVETLRLLEQQGRVQPPVPFIIGSDALLGLPSWREPRTLLEKVCFLQAPRPGCDFVDALPLPNSGVEGAESALEPSGTPLVPESRPLVPVQTHAIAMPALALSSSWIRECLKNASSASKSLRYFLPEPVCQYIQDNQLYR